MVANRKSNVFSSSAHRLMLLALLLLSSFEAYALPPVEEDVLLNMKQSWKDPTGTLLTWIIGKDCSSWNGVTCDSNGKVIQMNLGGNQLSGPLPPSIGKLTSLQNLELTSNQLTGAIPSSIGNLKSLTSLSLTSNQLSGVIPSSIGDLKSLQYLSLDSNQLSGSIPSSIGDLKSLKYLYLTFNQFSGAIPSSIGNLKSLTYLSLVNNRLSSAIPSSIGSLTSNQLSGVIPSSIGDLKSLQYLYLSSNQFSGAIPSSIRNLNILQTLFLQENFLINTSPIACSSYNTCNISSNCLARVENQRSSSECSSFCGANSASGPCGGYGVCAFNAKKEAKCTCEAGRSPPNCLIGKVKSSPPPPPPSTLPSPSPPPLASSTLRDTWLIPEPKLMSKRNPFFRYASYGFMGTEDNPKWNIVSNIDWREEVDIAQVEDQQTCNACWAMATVAAVECLLSISGLGLKTLSKQQILDCQGTNKTCGGGWPTDAFEYMATIGVARKSAYPWAYRNQVCKATPNSGSTYGEVKIAMYEEVDFYGSFGLVLAIQNQPVIVNIQSNSEVFQSYRSDIMDKDECFTSMVDHTVLVVGYNLFQGPKPHWIIRNSWGTDWGENGYMRLAYTGGLGICGIHSTPAYYPVLPFPETSIRANSDFPCGRPNPCGGGTCSINPTTKLNKCSNCPASSIVVNNIDGTQACAPKFICQQKAANPCDVGTCVDDMKGGYTCICPRGYVQTSFSDTDKRTCIEATSITKELIYTVQGGDTCPLISISFGLSKQQFQTQNRKIDCSKLVPGRTKVNVTQNTKWAGCSVKYPWTMGDSCYGISSLVGITPKSLLSLNPDLDCNDVSPGTQICVKSGNPPMKTPPCGDYRPVNITDSCTSILQQFKLNIFTFLLYNPGINCRSLLPQTSQKVNGNLVCVDGAEPFGKSRQNCKGRKIIVRKYDTCMRILVKFFDRSMASFKKKNFGFSCFGRRLKLGQTICL